MYLKVRFLKKRILTRWGRSVSIQLHCTFTTEYYEKGRLHEQKD